MRDNDILKQFFAKLDASDLSMEPDACSYLREKMQKCFPFHNRIAFE